MPTRTASNKPTPPAAAADRLESERIEAGGLMLVIATGHALSLAVIDGGRLLAAADVALAKGQAEALVPAIAELLAPLGGRRLRLSRLLVETGPGSFTGLRIGLAAAGALALAHGAELAGIRSTQLVAADMRARGLAGELLVLLAAPRGQVWLERFAAGGPGGLASLAPPEALLPAEAAARAAGAALVAGTALPLLGLQGVAAGPRAAAAALLPVDAFGPAQLLYVRRAEPDAG